ncbi:unnamed protein product [Thlaspi arvense]|uniref:KIB1-4 beta-propeller domain-containing protein n=1 Tax=Thlaspi arvense TaxID=13288 RepID=A0AAU9S3Q0_THLAR|nr:unnamed protein product [Thlaspi arvense]
MVRLTHTLYHLSSPKTSNTMRSLLLSRLSRLSLRKPPPLVLRQLGGVRFLSKTPICHIVGAEPCGFTPRDGEIGAREPDDRTGTIGASNGWVATLKDGVVCLQDDLIPSASDSAPKRISLPPLETLPHCQTQLVTNVAMSSASPDEDEDCILAVKFVGPQLSLCRPALGDKAEWFNIRITDPGFFSSRVMYSRRDKMFSMPGSGGTRTGSWDLEKHRDKPKLQTWRFLRHPEFVQTEWGDIDTCYTTEQLVESRHTGDMFMVKRFRERNYDEGDRMEEKQIMVFKLDGDEGSRCYNGHGDAIYTEDIGDLCIFLSKSEPFCLQASLYGNFSNSIYFVDDNGNGMFNYKFEYSNKKYATYPAPYFIPPQSYLNAYV